jgi:probable HAF family extracellular repeat protein
MFHGEAKRDWVKFRCRNPVLVLATLGLTLGVVRAQQPPQYSVIDLAFANANYSIAINNSGQLTGQTNDSQAFLYSNGSAQEFSPGDGTSAGNGLNSSGQVTGIASYPGDGTSTGHGFVYSGGSSTELATLGGNYSSGNGINDSGQLTGSSTLANGAGHAFVYSGGSLQDLGTLGGDTSEGSAINNSGQMTGSADLANGDSHAFLYSNGMMHDLGTLGGPSSGGVAINQAGQIAGTSAVTSETGSGHAFLYSNGKMHDLDTLGGFLSQGFGLNNLGQVVGQSETLAGGLGHGFLYTGGTMYDLNTFIPAWMGTSNVVVDAYSINDLGQITAEGVVDGQVEALLLDPITVPEPSTCSLLIVGALLGSVALTRRLSRADLDSAKPLNASRFR